VLLVVPFLAAVLLSGCSAADPADPPASLTPGSTSSAPTGQPPATTAPPTTDPDAATKTEILRVYRTFMAARNKSLRNPEKPPDRRLFDVSVPPARSQAYNLVLYYRERGVHIGGNTRSRPLPPALSGGKNATIRDCVDGSDAIPVVTKTGKSVIAPGQPPRLWVDVGIERRMEKWVVNEWNVRRGSPC
jgi:hypothetical protein